MDANANEIGKRAALDAAANAALLTPLAAWVFEGVNGVVMCTNCGIRLKGMADDDICQPCPAAWRVNGHGVTEYWRTPRHKA